MNSEATMDETVKRPVNRLIVGGTLILGLAGLATISSIEGNRRQQRQLENDRITYDVAEDVIGRELVSIPWNSNNPDVPGAIDSIRNFGDSVGINLVTDQNVYVAPTNGSVGFWATKPQVDFNLTKTTIENVAQYLETPEGDGQDQFARYHVILRSISGGYLGTKDTKGEALLRLQDELEKPAGVTRTPAPQLIPGK